MGFNDLKIGDEVDIVAVKGSPYKRNVKRVRYNTEIITVKGKRVIQVQVKYRKLWYREKDFGRYINTVGGELSELR